MNFPRYSTVRVKIGQGGRWLVDNKYTVAIFIAAFMVYLWISVYRHLSYSSNAYDLSIFAQTSYLLSHWQEPYSTVRMIFEPADHFGPTYFIISMGYALFNSPVYLLMWQIASALVGGVAVWLLARDVLSSKTAANFLLIAFFFQIGLIKGINFDFSTTALSVGFTAWAIYWWHKQRFWPYVAAMVLAIGCKEDMPVLFGAFSLYMAYRRQWKWFLTTLLYSVAWYVGVIYYLIPVVFNEPYNYAKLANPLNGLAVKEQGLRETMIQNLGLALANPLGILFAGANFFTRFMKGGMGYWLNEFHYGANIAAPLIMSTALGIRHFVAQTKLDKRTATILLTMAIAVVTLVTTGPVLNYTPKPALERAVVDTFLAQIPEGASVSAQNNLNPHLTNRKDIYLFPRLVTRCTSNTNCPQVDYIVLSEAHNAWPLTKDEFKSRLAELMTDPAYRLIKQQDGLLLFQHTATATQP